jgi:TM2 domain-containing membrane protein YozV
MLGYIISVIIIGLLTITGLFVLYSVIEAIIDNFRRR